MKHIFTKSIAFIAAGMMMSATAIAQISITGSTYTQNFDGIGGDDVTEEQIAASEDSKRSYPRSTNLPEGWRVATSSSVRTCGTYEAASSSTTYIGGASLPSNAKNGTWNFGGTGSTDRAVGGITSSISGGARTINVMAKLHNDAGVDYKSIALEYDIEKYRNGANTAGFVVQLFTSADGETWTSAGSEFYITYSKDANTNGNAVVPIDSRTISSALNIDFNNNSDLFLAWSISPASGDDCSSSMALSIDNVSITPSTELADLYAISITGIGEVTENFNTIGGEDVDPASGTNNSFEHATTLPKGWKVERNMNAPREVNSYGTATKSTMWIGGTSLPHNAKNGTWNFGATGNPDRAIGGLSTGSVGGDAGTRCVNVMARLHNDSETNLDVLSLSYDIEKYRKGNNSEGFTVQLYTSADGISWTSAGNSFKTTYVADAETNGYADVPGNITHVVNALHVNFPVGSDLYLAWNISVSSGTTCSSAQGLAIDNVSITPALASNELFATYQKQGDTFYKGDGSITDYSDFLDLDVNYYIASCGQTMLLRAKNPGADVNFDGAGWATQLRVQNNAGGSQYEVQACTVVDNHHHYTGSGCQTQFTATTDDLKIHFFLNSNKNPDGAYRLTETFNYNRASINNHIDDNTAPTLDVTKVSQSEDGADLVFTFDDGAVTASEEFFYYVADKDHSIGNISLTNEVRITKPTIQDGTTYKFKCYAVDYNGNKSDYKEFTLAMPFDENVDLARNKPASAGAVQNDNTADRAVNGNAGQFWTCYGQGDASTTWWKVDLTNVYNLDHIKIHFNDINAAYNIYASTDNVSWSAIISEATASTDETKTHTGLTASARYLKVTSSDNRFGIKEFEVYATGIATPDETDPTVTVSCPAKTINTATLQIIAADEDDEHNAGTITSIKVTGDNGFVEQEVLGSLVENQITLSGLNFNTTYNFTVTVRDKAGNTASETIEVELPFNTALNLAKDKTCSAGGYQTGHGSSAANDGDADTYWGTYDVGDFTTKNYWEVDLGAAYVLSRTVINRAAGGSSHAFTLQGKMKEGDPWSTIFEDLSVAASTSEEKTFNAAARYLRFSALQNSMVAVNEFEVYGTAFAAPDEINPTLVVTCPAKDVTSATLQIVAADKDDADHDGTIRAINISGDNDFVTQKNVTLDGSNQITLSGLKDNTTYTFTVTAIDLAGNSTSEEIVVELPFNTDLNICLGKTATDGYHQGDLAASRAIDGIYEAEDANSKWNTWEVSTSTHGYDDNWMRVDLGAAYNLRNVTMSFDWHYENPVTEYVIEGSLDDSNWYLIDHVTDQSATSASLTVNAPARYVRFRAITHQSLGIYEFEVYASGFSTLTDDAPVVTFVKVGAVDDATAEIEIDAADITTKPITTYMVSGLGGDPVEVTASEGKITLTSLSQSTHYTVDIQAKDESGNLSAAKQVEFTTSGSVTGLYVYSGYFGPWGEETKTLEIARFSTTSEPNVLRLKVTNMTAGDHLYKLYNATNTRCTFNDCGAGSDHYVYLTSAQDVYFYATDEDHFISSADNLYLCGSLVGEDQALVWNEDHTVATWSGALDLSGTKKFTIVKKNGATQQHVYDHDFYTEVQTFDGDYVYGMFTLDLTKMTGTWGYVELAFGDDATDNTAAITENNGRIATVTINRDILANNTWYTLCLPFDLDADKVNEVFGASTIATLESSDDHGSIIHLNFDYVSVIEAGKPYLIKPGQDFVAGSTISGVTIENVDPSAVGYKAVAEHMHFQGTFNKIMLEGEDKRYVSANNELYAPNPDGGSKIGAFRCYFTIPGGSSALAPGKRAVIVFGPQQNTGTGNVQGDSVPCTKVLMDGVLYIIREGKTYNVMGMEIQ